ncbi:CaiB/BaiF CoA transferase family protein [Actinomycetospora sp. C-140]
MTGPLAGVRVLELGGIGPAPFAALQLAGMGADVVRVDQVDAARDPLAPPLLLAQGKRSVAIDLRTTEGRDLVLDLAATASIMLDPFRPGVVERLGVGPSDCHARNPALVYGRMTGWGQDGPWADAAGHDVNYISLTGALHAIGRADQPPTIPLALVGDLGGGGMFLVAGVLAALWESARTGRGQVIDAAIVDGAAALMEPFFQFARDGSWSQERASNMVDSGLPWYDVYETADGGFMSVGALESKFYDLFASELGLTPNDGSRDDPASWPRLRAAIAARFRSESRAHWETVFSGTDACVAPVLSMLEAAAHQQVAARGTVRPDEDGLPMSAPAPRFVGRPSPALPPRPPAGAHTREVIETWGSRRDVEDLVRRGIVVQR